MGVSSHVLVKYTSWYLPGFSTLFPRCSCARGQAWCRGAGEQPGSSQHLDLYLCSRSEPDAPAPPRPIPAHRRHHLTAPSPLPALSSLCPLLKPPGPAATKHTLPTPYTHPADTHTHTHHTIYTHKHPHTLHTTCVHYTHTHTCTCNMHSDTWACSAGPHILPTSSRIFPASAFFLSLSLFITGPWPKDSGQHLFMSAPCTPHCAWGHPFLLTLGSLGYPVRHTLPSSLGMSQYLEASFPWCMETLLAFPTSP